MTDLDYLREALHARPTDPLPELDLGLIMVAGGRLRRRRRLRAVLTSGATLSVLLAVGSLIGYAGNQARIEIAATPSALPAPSAVPITSAPKLWSTPRPTFVTPAGAKPLGEVVTTNGKSGSPVLYMVAPDAARYPGVDRALVSGRWQDDKLIGEIQVATTRATGKARGFRVFHRAAPGERPGPSFGYYIGSVVSIYAIDSQGKHTTAKQVQWSGDPGVVIFWFNGGDLDSAQSVKSLSALNSDGTHVTVAWSNLGKSSLLPS